MVGCVRSKACFLPYCPKKTAREMTQVARRALPIMAVGRSGRQVMRVEKGSTWTLDLEHGAIVAARYLPAPG